MYDMTVEEVRNGLKETQTIIVPVGVVEQHGYHLPLSVDTRQAVNFAAGASALTGCFVAPQVNYCFSGGMLPGTINISPQVFSLVLMDIFRSLAVQGFKNIVVLLGHGGTEAVRAANDACENFQRMDPGREGVTIALVPSAECSPTFMSAENARDWHAARVETSIMMYYCPDLVRMDKAKLDSPEMVEQFMNDPDSYVEKRKLIDHKWVVPKMVQWKEMQVGVMGDFSKANAEYGQKIHEEVVENLAKFIELLQATENK
jgi:creatinine amidohydrolase